MSADALRGREEFRFRRLDKPEELRAVEEVERQAFGLRTDGPTPPTVLRSLQDHGGLVLGAFSDIFLAGYSVGFLGWDGTTLYHYSLGTAVRPEYQNHRLGFRLKLFQRDEVLRQGLGEIRWVFDPLSSRAAALSVRKLGAQVTGYKVHYVGQVDSAADGGTETDRISVRWPLRDPLVEARLAAPSPDPSQELARIRAATAIVDTDIGDSGLRTPVTVAEPNAPVAHLEIPFDIQLIRAQEGSALRTWRHAVRDAFRAALDLGYEVDGFAVVSIEHERRSFYSLRRRAEPPPRSAGQPE